MNWTLTFEMMDKAQGYIKANKLTIYQTGRKGSVALARSIRKHYGKAQDTAVEAIANQALEQTGKLMGVDCSIGNLIAKARARSN